MPGALWVARERGDKKEAFFDVCGCGDGDVEFWGREVRARFKLPVCEDGRRESKSSQEGSDDGRHAR